MTVGIVMTVGYHRLPNWAYCENGLEHQNTVKPRYTVQLGSRGFERYTVWKRYIASSLINYYKGLK